MGGGGASWDDDYPGAIEFFEEEAKRVGRKHKCAHCGNPRKDDDEQCPGCGSREVKHEFRMDNEGQTR